MTSDLSVEQTTSLRLDNHPTWGELLWFVEKARQLGVESGDPVDLDIDTDDGSIRGLVIVEYVDTSPQVLEG